MTKKPSYRFVRYTEPWEEKKLSDGISKIGDGIHGTPVYSEDGDYYFINGNNLVDGKIFLFPETKKVQSNQLTVSDTSLKKNTILMSINGTIGSLAWYRDEKVMLGKSVAYLTTEEFDRKFIYSILQTPKILKHFNNNLTGTTIKNLGLKTIRETVISLPSLPEQTAIGSFFQDIDQLISLQQRKLEVLKEQKQTYLKLLFPAKGQTKPALRFAEFEDDWKEVKLGEVTNIKTGGRDVQDSVEDGLYPFYIRSEEVKRINSYSFDGEAILIPGEGRLGEIFHYVNGKFDVHQRVYKISNFTDVNAKFVLQQMKKDFKQHAMRNTVKATVDSLRLPTIQSFTVFVPSLPEQEAIGSFFQDIDKAIAKQEEKVNQLKESKQTLLRKMFI